MSCDGVIYTSAKDKANAFNQYVYESFNSKKYDKPEILSFSNDNLASLVLTEEVLSVSQDLASNKAIGIDGLSPLLLKECALECFLISHWIQWC